MEDAVGTTLAPWISRLAPFASRIEPLEGSASRAFTLRVSIGHGYNASAASDDSNSNTDLGEYCEYVDTSGCNPLDRLPQKLRQIPRTIVEFIRLVDTFRSVDDVYESTLLRLLCGFASSRVSIQDRRLAQSAQRKNIRDSEGLDVVLAGSVPGLCEVLRLLCVQEEDLGGDFEKAKQGIVATLGDALNIEAQCMPIRLWIDVACPSARKNQGRVELALLSKALTDWNESTSRSSVYSIEGVTLRSIRHPKTLQAIIRQFPSETPLEEVHCGGNVGDPHEIRALFEDSSKLPRIRHLVLEYPMASNTLEALYSEAIKSSASIEVLTLNGVLQDSSRESSFRNARWCRLTETLLGSQTIHNLKELCIREWVLLDDDVEAIKLTLAAEKLKTTTDTPRASSISTLRLFVGSTPSAESTIAGLLLALEDHLQLNRLAISVADVPLTDTAVIAAGDAFASTLQELSLTNVEVDSFAPFFSTSAGDDLRLSSLRLDNVFISNMTVYEEIFDALSDPRQPIAKHLTTLQLRLSPRHDDKQCIEVISLARHMLQANTGIASCEIVVNKKAHRGVDEEFAEAHGQSIVAVVDIKCRLGFLSAVHVDTEGHHSKKPRVTTDGLHLPGIAVARDIFAFAAKTTKRIARVKMVDTNRVLG